ncbi:hypothetical protein ACU4GD_27580 [Cupriavidus basilensis]
MARRELSVLTEGHTFLEGPRWHEGRLWLSDFYTHGVMAVSLDGTVEPIAESTPAAFGPGLAAGRAPADRLDARPQAAAARSGRQPQRACRPSQQWPAGM